MNNKRTNKTRKIVISLLLVIVSMALLFLVSSAKYRKEINGNIQVQPASFNTVILGSNNKISEEKDRIISTNNLNAELINPFGKGLNLSSFIPGMTYSDSESDTSRHYDFAIANGIDLNNVSNADIEYSICLRTTRNLPLSYKLIRYTYDDGNQETELFEGSEPVLISNHNPDNPIYEIHFRKEDNNTLKEATFGFKGNNLAMENYSLILEWPFIPEHTEKVTIKGTNSVDYIKEVDVLELFVVSSSVNYLKETNEETFYPEYTYIPDGLGYSKGLIVLNPNKGSATNIAGEINYTYSADLRSFVEKELDDNKYEYLYAIKVDNDFKSGIDYNNVNGNKYYKTTYEFELRIPYDDVTKDYNFTLAHENDDKDSDFQISAPLYYLYDIYLPSETYGEIHRVSISDEQGDPTTPQEVWKKGEGASLTQKDIEAINARSSEYRLYKSYRITVRAVSENDYKRMELVNLAKNKKGEYETISSSEGYNIVLKLEDGSKLVLNDDTAFYDKLDIIVKARYVSSPESGE